MYLMALVNSTVVGRRPTGHVELVDLSVDTKKAVERYKEQSGNLRRSSAEVGNLKPSASPRSRRALAKQPDADLCMEPLFPLFLGSPSSDSSEADTALRVHHIPDAESLPCESLKDPSVNVVGNTIEAISSRQQEQDRELPRIRDKQLDMKEAEPTVAETVVDGSKTIKPSKPRSTPKLGSLFSDGGVSTRVQRHPLEMIAEQEVDGDSDSSPRTRGNTSVVTSKHSAEGAASEKLDLSARVLQHPLARIDESPVKERPAKETPVKTRSPVKESPVRESPVKERKPTVKKERRNSGAPSPQPVRKAVRDAKPDVKHPQKRERAKLLRESRAPIITKPKSPTLGSAKRPEAKRADVNDQEKPSLANPVMEKMPQVASPEPPYAWNKKLQNLPKLEVSNMDTEPMMEERELRYSSPKMTESDAQDDLSFRVWERESKPKRKSISVSRDFQDSLDLESSQDLEEHTKPKDKPKPTPAQSGSSPGKEKSMEDNVTGKTFDTRPKRPIPNVEVDTRNCEESEVQQHEYPSPSSFTCGLSPTSLFSDDDMIPRFHQFPAFGPREDSATTLCKSPRSVLSQEPDDISHFASDSSIETRETSHHRQPASRSSMYNDESSDLGDSMSHDDTELNRRSFSTFTYTDKGAGETSSDEDHDREFSELRYFQEAGSREPWLGWKDGGVLDDTDLEFLLPPDFKDDDTPSIPDTHEEPASEISEHSPHSSPPSQKSQTAWVPYVTGTDAPARSPARGGPTRRHSRSSSFSKTQEKLPQRPPKRSVKFAPDLVREASVSTPRRSIRLPLPESSPARDDDEQIYPSVKSWEVKEEDSTSTTSTPRRRWRRSPSPKPNPPASDNQAEADPGPSTMASSRRWRRCRGKLDDPPSRRRDRVAAHILPCAGRLFSWPQRLAFKVSRSRRLHSDDDDSAVGTESSFGGSARRDAQQVRRILKGSQKKFSNLTVADILDDNFASQ